MVVFLHVAVALASIAAATLAFFQPSKARFVATYSLIAGTLASGIYLVWISPAKMLHVCLAGVGYASIVTAITVMARVRFAKLQKDSTL